MLHLNGILQGEGKICVAGLPVTEQNLGKKFRQRLVLFSKPDDQLFSPTVFDDVAFGPLHMGLLEALVRAYKTALAAVGMQGYTDRISHHLSIGEKNALR